MRAKFTGIAGLTEARMSSSVIEGFQEKSNGIWSNPKLDITSHKAPSRPAGPRKLFSNIISNPN
jgi:hypothetical protein